MDDLKARLFHFVLVAAFIGAVVLLATMSTTIE